MAELRDQLQATLGDSLILEHELGGGGMSRVFVAHEAALGRKVVVKVLPPEMAAAVSIDRFRREIQLAAQLQHPHIVPLLSAGETNGLPYYTMPFVRGDSLRSRLAKAGELPVAETVRILREIASALAYAHEAGVVHRDIKPENVLISGGSAVVTDFGVAKALTASSGANAGSLTSLGVALGTPAYMAPEQATADPNIDHRADIYALGVMAYEMLSGSTPFPGRSPQATLAAHVTENPEGITRRRATVPPLLASLVMSCLAKHPADRPQTAEQVMNELDAMTTPSGGMEPTARLSSHRASGRRGMWIGIAAALAVIVIGAFAVSRMRARTAASNAEDTMPAVAVLPFENVGRAEGQEFTDGMTEEVTNRLSSLRGLRVISRQSARGYAGTTKTPQQIATELGVSYLLTGTVRWDRSADGKELVRVSPALVRGSDATQVWSEPYQAAVAGMFDVQSKIASDVANALDVKLIAPEKAALTERPTENLEAYSLFVRGRQLIENSLQPSQFREAVSVLQRATAADPKFASAWAYLAVAHTEMFWFFGDRSQERLRMAREALAQAVKLDPDNPDVHFARGTYLYHGERDYSRALAEFALVQKTRPNDPNAPASAAAIMRRQGKWDEAIANLKRAVELDPRNGRILLDLANTLAIRKRYAEAEEYADRGMIISPDEAFGTSLKVELALAQRGNAQEAIGILRAATAKVPASSLLPVLQQWTWPAIEDPSLRRMLIDATPSPDQTRSDFYLSKGLLFRYLGDSVRSRAYADSAISDVSLALKSQPDPSPT
jgi:serine/threonine-protein kinase